MTPFSSRVTSIRLANATRASYAYDDADRLLRLANLGTSGATLSSFRYSYDGAGDRTRVVEANGDVVTWSYDNTYQLTREWRSGANSYAITYTYDPVGNRLTKRDATVPTTYAYDAANQVRWVQDSTGYTTYSFDGAGNLSRTTSPTNQRTTYSWDSESGLTQVSLPSGTVDVFVFNGDGQRVQKQDSNGTTKFIWDGENILAETNTSNVIQAVYSLEPVRYGNLISERRASSTSNYHFDGLGSADRLSDATGTVTDSYLYQAFGKLTVLSGATTNPFKYVGRLGYSFDPDLSKYYLRARIYDPAHGLFLSRDPRPHSSTRLYAYVDSNPVNRMDPNGTVPIPQCSSSAFSVSPGPVQVHFEGFFCPALRQVINEEGVANLVRNNPNFMRLPINVLGSSVCSNNVQCCIIFKIKMIISLNAGFFFECLGCLVTIQFPMTFIIDEFIGTCTCKCKPLGSLVIRETITPPPINIQAVVASQIPGGKC